MGYYEAYNEGPKASLGEVEASLGKYIGTKIWTIVDPGKGWQV